jgi:hypothetical protein
MRELTGYLVMTLLAIVVAVIVFKGLETAITSSVNRTAEQIGSSSKAR